MPDRPVPNPTLFRGLLIALGGVQTLNGLYALFAPRAFYDDFPFGRGWVAALPAYNEHLVRDVGGLFLATGVLLVIAGVILERRLVAISLVTWLLFAVPHTVYHLFNLDGLDTGDAIGNVVTLASTVLIPIWLLAWLARAPRLAAPAPAPLGENGWIPLVEKPSNPLVRAAFRTSRKRFGVVMDPLKAFGHHPTLLAGYAAFETSMEHSHRAPERLKELAVMRAAMLTGCEWCLDFGYRARARERPLGGRAARPAALPRERALLRARQARARLRHRAQPHADRGDARAGRAPARAPRRGADRGDHDERRAGEHARPLQRGARARQPGLHRRHLLRAARRAGDRHGHRLAAPPNRRTRNHAPVVRGGLAVIAVFAVLAGAGTIGVPAAGAASSAAVVRAKAVAWAVKQSGVRERGLTNCSPTIDRWTRHMGLSPCRAWCGSFVHEAFLRAGVRLSPRLIDPARAYRDAVADRRHLHAIAISSIRPGDILFFAFEPGKVASHLAIVRGFPRNGSVPTVEGNTGNAVRLKVRGLAYPVLAARVVP